MSTFLFAYRAPKDYQPGDPGEMAAWHTFFENMGSSVVEVGEPIFARTSLGNPAQDTVLAGYSLIAADDLESAVALAQDCPTLRNGGGLEIGEITVLSEGSTATTADDRARATGLAS
jgi:hypothetical protein